MINWRSPENPPASDVDDIIVTLADNQVMQMRLYRQTLCATWAVRFSMLEGGGQVVAWQPMPPPYDPDFHR